MLIVWIFIGSIWSATTALDNGLALTPPMGWLSWFTFRCNTDCHKHPDSCISENLIRRMADEMITEGYAKAGYNYVIIDDCWASKERDQYGRLQPDPIRFPSGMKALADYIHSKGLKFGIYGDIGSNTCQGYPGSVNHMQQDAEIFASWEVDYVKVDGCYMTQPYSKGYPEFGYYLNRTGRPMVYSCSWPAYDKKADYNKIETSCNLWRYTYDIENSWNNVYSIINYTVNHQEEIAKHAGPGHWNDPDMLIIGGSSLTYDQSKLQMALWAILAAPLLLSADLRNVKPQYKSILLNNAIIAINQDKLGIQGRMVMQIEDVQYWIRPILPIQKTEYSYAVAVINVGSKHRHVNISPEKLNMFHSGGYIVEDLYNPKSCANAKFIMPDHIIRTEVNPTGVILLRFTIASKSMCQPHI